MFKTYSMELAGRKLTIETGKMAELANASVLVRYGDTVVMVNVTASKEPREGIDFFPLSVDYEEYQEVFKKEKENHLIKLYLHQELLIDQ